MKHLLQFATSAVLLFASVLPAAAKTVPTPTPAPTPTVPAPALVAPASGASLVQPIAISWSPVTVTTGSIGSYTWQVGTTSAFTTIILSGFTNQLSDTLPAATADKVSGLPNGTYFWRVKASQLTGGPDFSVDSPWSAVRTFTVAGLGAAPGTPAFIAPANGRQFHVREFFDITWTAVPGAQYYILEADDEPTFSYPINLQLAPLNFGTQFHAGWGNPLNVYYRVRAVSSDNVRGLPSVTLAIHITNAAPVPPAPSQISPAPGATVSLPFTFKWTETANPQIPAYDVDIDTDPTFSGPFGALMIQSISRSDYLLTSDNPVPLLPGSYFWRVRALHGEVIGPWSAGRPLTVTAAPPAPAGSPNLFYIIAEPGSAEGGNPTQAKVTIDAPAPAGGTVVTVASDFPKVDVPGTVFIPAGKTDALLSPITTFAVSGTTVGNLRATLKNAWQQSSLGLLPLITGTSLNAESVIGGTAFNGTITLQGPAPAGGAIVRLISSDASLARIPATVSIPAGGRGATFTGTTSAVSKPTRIVIETGTDDGSHAPQAWLTLAPVGSATPAASLAALTLSQPVVAGGATSTATVTLTSPAPAGGALVTLNGVSMEGEVITPGSVTIPAGSLSAIFNITPPQVMAPSWSMIQAHYGTSGGGQMQLLEIDPIANAPATLLAMIANTFEVVGGQSLRGSAGLILPAAVGGGVVSLASDNPAVLQVPPTVTIAEGNTANSFNITSSPVLVATPTHITATAGGVTKTFFVNVAPDPNAPPLLKSVSINPASVAGGTSAAGTVLLSSPAPAGGITVTLATSNPGIATVPGVAGVPAGQTTATFPVTTFAVTANTSVTITAFYDSAPTATLAVTRGSVAPPTPTPSPALAAPSLISPGADARFAPGTNITFDWSDVGTAASYGLQVSDQSSFSTQIVNQTVTASKSSTASLPTKTLWFRARALSSTGAAGAWSAARRFEVKN